MFLVIQLKSMDDWMSVDKFTLGAVVDSSPSALFDLFLRTSCSSYELVIETVSYSSTCQSSTLSMGEMNGISASTLQLCEG